MEGKLEVVTNVNVETRIPTRIIGASSQSFSKIVRQPRLIFAGGDIKISIYLSGRNHKSKYVVLGIRKGIIGFVEVGVVVVKSEV